jgi:uncharacterized protein (DUF1800 family)
MNNPAKGRQRSRAVGSVGPPQENLNVFLRLLDVPRRHILALIAALSLAACGGGGGGDSSPPPPPTAQPTRAEAGRFLAQASMGPTSAEIDRVVALGYGGWIDAQLALPATSHRVHWDARDAAIRAATPGSTTAAAGQEQIFESFWKQAVTGEDQLRQRMVWALSQIFVISMADDTVGNNTRAVAAWLDMLGDKGLGTYRELLESVSRHPMMGVYLSHLRNQKANPLTGRVPDENYAREVMQLFSIGLVELNEDGSPRLSNGNPIDTYGSDDISGIARVFTGWSWACPDWPDNNCFSQGSVAGVSDPNRTFKPMQGYAQYHSTEEKRFLGTTIAAQTLSDPEASLRVALDALANHPNVGPFIGRQLIQRLVTSNPSPAYVRDISRVWANNGRGTRGDLKAVVRAILLHPEARSPATDTSGKVREPVLRLAALLRAFDYRSDTGWWRVGNTDNPGSALGQSPMRSPSVFNFYRPGYVAPGTLSAARGLAAPELQLAHETSAAGLVNYLRDAVAVGVGANNTLAGVTRRDIQADFSAELGLATDPGALVDRVFSRLLPHTPVPAELRSDVVAAVGSITLPTSGSTATALRNRVNTALLLTLVSAEFQVQR